GAGTTYSFSYNDNYGPQSGSFIVSENNITSLNFSHSNQASFPSSSWTISQNDWENQYTFSFFAQSPENTTFSLSNGNVQIQSSNGGMQGGWDINVQQSSSAAIDLRGKNITLEAVSGPDSTFIDGEGQNSALSLDAESDDYDGYASSTEFIGFTFMDGPDDEPLINIVGPGISSSLDWAPTFTNCRFIDSDLSADDDHIAPILIERAEPTFDGCEFRDLNIEASSNFNSNYLAGPIRIIGEESSGGGGYDTTAFRPQFKNCVIAENSLKRGSFNESSSLSMRGGAVYVGFGAIPYFENTRIDSNIVDSEEQTNNYSAYALGGGIALDNYLSRGAYIRFVNCSISGNKIKGDGIGGGGLWARFPAVSLTNCVLVNNEMDGTYADNNQWQNSLGGAIFYDTDAYGTGIFPEDPELRIVNSTIADNSITNIINNFDAVGGAGISRKDVNDHSITIFNSIVYDNVIDTYLESQNYRMNLSTNDNALGDDDVQADFSIIEFFTETDLDEDDLLDIDPGFVGNGDYSLA
ncbi:MAG: hypothetical protein V1257_11005, partial [Candidatus Neomarinimicrobiota bacterium]|nr:hypothetical protein [Candidatus Neomarinimicrobiota bacterium]